MPASSVSWVVALVGATPSVLPKLMARMLLKRLVVLLKVPPVTVQVAGLAPVPRPPLPPVWRMERVPAPVLVMAVPPAPAKLSVLAKVVVPPVVVIAVPVLRVSVPLWSR